MRPGPTYRERQVLFRLGLRRRWGWRQGRALRRAGGLHGGLLLTGGCRRWGPVAGWGGGRRAGGRGSGRVGRAARIVHGCPLFVLAGQGGGGARCRRLLQLAGRLERVPPRTTSIRFGESSEHI